MANNLNVRIVEDGQRNAIVNLVGVVDTADMSAVSAINVGQFLTNSGTLQGFKLRAADYSVTDGLTVALDWNSNTPQPMCAFSAAGRFSAEREGVIAPNKQAGGYDGSINVSTRGFVPGKTYSFTVKLRMTKAYA